MYYYDKRAKKLYASMDELVKDHPFLMTPGSEANAQAYMFRSDIEQLTQIMPPVAPNYAIYTLVPGEVNVADNTVQMVATVRKDISPNQLRDILWAGAKEQLDGIYAQYMAETPAVEQASWSLQLAEANCVKAYLESPDIMPADQTPVLDLMVSQRKVPNETVFDLARLVLAAANRYAMTAANLVGQWQRVDRALRAATTLEELIQVNVTIHDPVVQANQA